jgi:hypothetical protein
MIIISCPCTISLWSYGHHTLPHTPSSHVLLMPNSKHLTRGISNLMSLITKTKLGLSISPFLVIDDNHHKDMKWNQFSISIVLAPLHMCFHEFGSIMHICMDLKFERVTTIKLMLRYIEWTFEAWYQSELPLYTILSIDVARHHLKYNTCNDHKH